MDSENMLGYTTHACQGTEKCWDNANFIEIYGRTGMECKLIYSAHANLMRAYPQPSFAIKWDMHNLHHQPMCLKGAQKGTN